MKNKRLIVSLSHFGVVIMIASMLLAFGWAAPDLAQAAGKAPDKIRFGNPIALSAAHRCR